MLKDRILATLRFFDLQDMPLTLLELHKFLLAEPESLQSQLDENWDLKIGGDRHLETEQSVSVGEILNYLEDECADKTENSRGFYHLIGRKKIVDLRADNYLFGVRRERLIRRFLPVLRHLPFLRAVALAGSQALGQQKSTSDIDLFVITDPEYLWLARIFITGYLQLVGKRRHQKKIANRFCLNHYLAGPRNLSRHRDLYNAMEYLRFRPLFGAGYFAEFYENNLHWLNRYFPNFQPLLQPEKSPSRAQRILEKIFTNAFGRWLNEVLGKWQLKRIRRGEFVVADYTELAFHSLGRKKAFLTRFFKFHQQQYREAVKAVV